MTPTEYKSMWASLYPDLLAVLTRVRKNLLAQEELAQRFIVAEVSLEEDADEFFALLLVSQQDEVPLAALQFTLVIDEAGTGFNVKLELDAVQAQKTLLSYMPQNYTPEVYVTDVEELKLRINDTDVGQFSNALAAMLQAHQP